jgi:hydrogenase nickel incorporation protein HypB
MCGTCGCGSEENGVNIQKPGEIVMHEHHEHEHHHHHDGQAHGHTHNHPHSHSHEHEENQPHKTILEIEQDILQQNDIMAARNRGYFDAKNVFAINLVSSPGSGKTSLLEKTLQDMKNDLPFYVIEGDQQTLNDANRIDALDVPVIQINTGKGCHLESDMIYKAIKKLDIEQNSILMIENVGNLVCPSMFDLGERKRVVIISTTEGEDKPIKYPDMFLSSDLCIINKIDLLPYLNLDMEKLKSFARQVNPNLEFLEVSAITGEGMQNWYGWLQNNLNS